MVGVRLRKKTEAVRGNLRGGFDWPLPVKWMAMSFSSFGSAVPSSSSSSSPSSALDWTIYHRIVCNDVIYFQFGRFDGIERLNDSTGTTDVLATGQIDRFNLPVFIGSSPSSVFSRMWTLIEKMVCEMAWPGWWQFLYVQCHHTNWIETNKIILLDNYWCKGGDMISGSLPEFWGVISSNF